MKRTVCCGRSAHHHRLGDGEVDGHAGRVVGGGLEVGVMVGVEEHERAVLDRPRHVAEDVVAEAALAGEAHLLDELHVALTGARRSCFLSQAPFFLLAM